MKNMIFLVLGLILIAGCTTIQEVETQEQNTNAIESTGEMKTFVLTGGMFWYEMDNVRNPELRVNLGDKVRIEFTSVEGFHDFVLDEFNATTEQVWAVNSTFVEFTADKTGEFEYYCSVGQHRANGMKGMFIVE